MNNVFYKRCFILSWIFILSPVSPYHSPVLKALDLHILFSLVAVSLCAGDLHVHSFDAWLHPPCVQQYVAVLRLGKLALSGFFCSCFSPLLSAAPRRLSCLLVLVNSCRPALPSAAGSVGCSSAWTAFVWPGRWCCGGCRRPARLRGIWPCRHT